MEHAEKEKINRHLTELLKLTICSAQFLSEFTQRKIFCKADVEALQVEERNKGWIAQSMKFYEIIQTRVGSYDILLEALRNTSQNGVLALLENNAENENGSYQIPSYIHPPKYVLDFLSEEANTTLVIHTPDCEITTDRIMETVENIAKHTPESFIRSIPVPCSQSVSTHQVIPLINCQHGINYIQYALKYAKNKIFVVPKELSDEIYNVLIKTQCKGVRHENDVLEWEDLHPVLQISIEETLRSFQFFIECIDTNTKLQGKVLFDLIKGKKPKLFKNTIPPLITYYIPRRLITRNVISKVVFQKRARDLFLIKGMKRHELSDIANGQETDTSSNLLGKGVCGNVNFALLDYEPDYDRIVSMVGMERPVHVIEFTADKFVWIKSSSGIETMQRAVDSLQNVLTEDEFLAKIVNSKTNKKDPVCISDSPGMGKSVLLAQLARKLLNKQEKPWNVAYVVISELVESVKQHRFESDLSVCVEPCLAGIICDNELGVVYFQKHKNELTNLLLDGFDELQEEDIDLGYELLIALREMLPETRIWVTTRPHMFARLEKSFSVLGYNILAFEEQDQIDFLKLYWSRENGENSFDLKVLEMYIQKCLSSLKFQINSSKEQDIAGIPLQCLLIGEVFEDDAIRFCTIENFSIPLFCFKSISDLYELVVQKKFDKFHMSYDTDNYTDADLQREHTFYSISLLFPTFLDKYTKKFPSSPISLQTIFSVGILEYKAVPPSTRFIHRTFAEFFVAKFVAGALSSHLSTDVFNLLHINILETKLTPYLKFGTAEISSNQFVHNVSCYFLDNLIGKANGVQCKYELNRQSCFNLSKWKQLCEACAYGNFDNIFWYLICDLPAFKPFERKIFTKEFVALCTMFSDATIATIAYEKFKIHSGKDLCSIRFQGYSLTRLAVIRGNYKVFEKNVMMMDQFSLSSGEFFWMLICDCLADSKSQSSSIIKEKIHILRYLLQKIYECNRAFKIYKQISPFCVHIDLTTELIRGGNLTLRQTIGLVHEATKQYKYTEFKNILEVIASTYHGVDNFINKVLNSTSEGKYLLELIVKNMNPDLEFLEQLNFYGMNFSLLNRYAFLSAARRRYCSKETLEFLLKQMCEKDHDEIIIVLAKSLNYDDIAALLELVNCTRPTQMDAFGNSLLHIACSSTLDIEQRLELIKHLIDTGADLNRKNKNFKTPIDVLLKHDATKAGLSMLELLLSSSGNCQQQIFLHKINWIARRFEKLKFVDYPDILSKVTSAVQPRDSEENTLLHAVAEVNDVKALEHLVSLGVDVNVQNKWGETPLHLLTEWNEDTLESWKVLIDSGANPCSYNSDGKTPIHQLHNINFVHSNCTNHIIYAMNMELQFLSSKLDEIFLLALSIFDYIIAEKLCIWFTENVGKSLHTLRGRFRGEQATVLDVVLYSGDGDCLEYIVNTHKCTRTLQPFGSCWFYNVLSRRGEKTIKFLKIVNKLYPNLINTPNEDGILPLSSKDISSDVIETLIQLGAHGASLPTSVGQAVGLTKIMQGVFPLSKIEHL